MADVTAGYDGRTGAVADNAGIPQTRRSTTTTAATTAAMVLNEVRIGFRGMDPYFERGVD